MQKYIIDPENLKKYSILSSKGKKLLKKLIKISLGGTRNRPQSQSQSTTTTTTVVVDDTNTQNEPKTLYW